MQAAAVIGYKNSGKTSLILKLCRYFKQKGLRIAVAKFSHHGLDLEGTDTGDLAELADAVLGLSESRTQLIWNRKKYLPDLTGLLEADLLLVEGGKQLTYLPKIILSETPEDIQNLEQGLTIGLWTQQDIPGYQLLNRIEDLAQLILDRGFLLPGLDCQACGREDCFALAREMVQGEASITDCLALHSSVQVAVNGSQLPLNPFVNTILANGIKGMLSPLKGYQPGRITISLEV